MKKDAIIAIIAFIFVSSLYYGTSFCIETFSKNNFDEKAYMELVQKEIKSHWTPIKYTQSSKIITEIEVNPNGDVVNIKIIESNANNKMNKIAIDAIKASKLPKTNLKENTKIEFTFSYNVTGG